MMNATEKENANRKRKFLLLIILVAFLFAVTSGLYFWQTSQLNEARLDATNPAVYIVDPGQGFTATTGRWIPIVASSTGPRLLQRIELWINGELIEFHESGLPGGVGVIYGHFALLVQEGAQTFVVRAIDAEGYVGQSDPVSITGYSLPKEVQPFLSVPFSPDANLEMIAIDYQIPVEEIINLNPEVLLQPEGVLRIPINPAEENTPSGPDQVPQELISQNGYVSGIMCYPSQYIPAMTAYFENTGSGQVTTLPISLNQNTYGISLPPGSYRAYAWLPDYSLGGSYSKAVPCGLTTNCTDHSLIEFQVQAGTCTKGIDICDWYDQPSVPTAPNAPVTPSVPKGLEINTGIPMLTPDKLFPVNNNASLPFAVTIPLKPPGVPGNFAARNDQCKIRIGWDIPGSNITGYTVWLSSQTGVKQLVAKLEPNETTNQQAWYEFTSPISGLISVWVEAYNAIGSTASSVATLKITEKCSTASGEDLEFEALELNVGGEYDKVYLYLSIEGIPEERLPADDSVFLAVQEGRAEIARSTNGAQTIILPKPNDGNLTIQGECWGWAGGELAKLSSFSESIPEADWSGYEKVVGNETCALNLNLKPKEDINNYQTMSGKGSGIPAPFNVRSEILPKPETITHPMQTWIHEWMRIINWQWKGEIKDITGFSIYHNGKLIATAPANVRSQSVILPTWCSDDLIRWRVIANGKKGQSPSSPITKELMQPCPMFAEVVFDNIVILKSCDSCCCDWIHINPFDELETYFFLTVNATTRQIGTKNFYVPLQKGGKKFQIMSKYSNEERFIVPIIKEPISLKISTQFYDYDWDSADDLWGIHIQVYDFKTFKDAVNAFGNSQETYNPVGVYRKTGKAYSGTADDYIYYRVWFYR